MRSLQGIVPEKFYFKELHPRKNYRNGQPIESMKMPKKTKNTPMENTAFQPPMTLFSASHIGSDEAGIGDYFGPITAGAAYITQERIPELKQIGVKDSKSLSDEEILAIAKEIAI